MAVTVVTAIVGAAMCGLFFALGYVSGKIKGQEVRGVAVDLPALLETGNNGLAQPRQDVGSRQQKESVG